ncbi:hypothetical protein CUMW_266800 [Citrus unshiu]|uniref:Uncharacterized protein n=1 Tax=Citrus unshiu TaxID=55188 RepID=A0A2H5QVX0_CITUN|nr:hypothetical protein CUMW_266800 [Citrus unshiu]
MCLCGIDENLSLLEHFVDSSRDYTNFTCKLMRRLDIALLCVQENPNDRHLYAQIDETS